MIVLSNSKANPDEEYDSLVDQGKLLDTKLTLPSGHISVSQVSTYMKCPKAYEFRYVKGIIAPPKAMMAEGKAMHRALEVGQQERLKSKQLTPLDILFDAHSDSWKYQRTDVEIWDEDSPEKVILKRSKIFLREYHKRFMPYQKPLGVEKRLWISTSNLHIPILGYIDLIVEDTKPQSRHEPVMPQEQVVDYKVTSKSISQGETDSSLQLTTYAHATGLSTVGFDMFVKTKAPQVKTIKSTRSAKQWKWAERIFEEVGKAISAGVFPPGDPASWACTEKWCGYWGRCRGGC